MDFLRRTFNQLLNLTTQPRANGQHPTARQNEPQQDSDIIRIALLLRTKLPADLVPIILDYAECWTTTLSVTSLHPDRIAEPQSGKLQAALFLPRNLPRRSVRRIRFTTTSRDQGWSSFPNDHDTYRGSWTWFDAGVRGLDPDNEEDIDSIHLNLPVDCQHRNALSDEHIKLCVAQPDRYKYGAKRLTANIHAGKEFKTHVVEWTIDDDDDDLRAMIREVKGGCRVEVSAHAQFPGWVNYVKNVKIEVDCVVIRKM